MEEKQARLLPRSKRLKKLQARDHFAKEWATILQILGAKFTKNLLETVKRFLKLEHKDLIL